MSIEITNNYNSYASAAAYNSNSSASTAAGSETTTETDATAQNVDSYTPTNSTGKLDSDVIEQMKREQALSALRFLNTVQSSLTKQIKFGQGAWKNVTESDLADIQAAAQESISDNGYWGVEQTSQRIFSFAQALTGGDVSQAEAMREAFIKGYQEVEKLWGGELPQVSQKTYDAVMKLFDEWEGITDDEENTVDTATKMTTEAKNTTDDSKETESIGGSVTFNEAKRARQLAAAQSPSDLQALMSLLNTDLSDCKAGLEKGWCDEAEVAKVEAMIRRAQAQMARVSGEDETQNQGGIDAFTIASL